MLQMYTANELREIHEERIAPFINKGNDVNVKPEESQEKSERPSFFYVLKRLTGTA